MSNDDLYANSCEVNPDYLQLIAISPESSLVKFHVVF